jgi:hypothetical protein
MPKAGATSIKYAGIVKETKMFITSPGSFNLVKWTLQKVERKVSIKKKTTRVKD